MDAYRRANGSRPRLESRLEGLRTQILQNHYYEATLPFLIIVQENHFRPLYGLLLQFIIVFSTSSLN